MKDNNSSKTILKTFYRGLPVIVFVVCVSVAVAKRYLHYTTPMYESTAKIKLADIREGTSNANLYKDFDVFVHNNKIGAEVELIKSEVLVQKALEKLDLGICVYRVGDIHKTELYNQSPVLITASDFSKSLTDKPFSLVISGKRNVTVTTPDGEQITGALNSILRGKNITLSIMLNDSLLAARPALPVNDNYEFIIHSQERLIANTIANLDVMSVDKDIPILRVSYKSAVAKKSADVVNAIAATYITDYIEEKCLSADTTENFLNEQLNIYNGKLSASEGNIEAYRDAKNIINIRQETETDLRKVADLKKQLASVQMNLRAIDSLNKYIAGNKGRFLELAPNFEAFTDLLSTEMVKNIKQLQGEREELLIRFTPENEKVQVVNKKIGDLTGYLQESIRNTQTNLKIKYDDLTTTIGEAEAAFVGLPEKEKTMTILERNFGLNEQIYRFLHEKRTEARIAKAANISFHRIISHGEVPTAPVSPNAKLITVFSGFLGFMFSVLGIFGIHHLKARVDNVNNIYRHSDIEVLTTLPFAKSALDKSKVFDKPALELDVKGQLADKAVISVNSLNDKEGKHFIATGLAQAAAELGHKVLLVCTDKNRPVDNGAYNVITVNELPAKIMRPTEWAEAIEYWQNDYNTIIVLNASVKKDTKAIIPMSAASLNIFVADSRITRLKELAEIDDMREKLSIPNPVFLLNREHYAPTLYRQFKDFVKQRKNA